MAAAPFGKNRLLGAKLHTAHEHVGRLAILADTHIPRGNAANGAGLVIQNLGSGKARIDFHAKRLGLLAKPATEIAKRNNVIAVIVHLRWCRHPDSAGFGQEHEFVGCDRCVQRRATFLPVRKKLVKAAWFKNRARQNMRANLAAFFIVSCVLSLAMLVSIDRFGAAELAVSLPLLPATLAGYWLARKTMHRISHRRLRFFSLILCAVAGSASMLSVLL